ncbi:UDP-N-acetylmuramate dehydrogenase [Candidatus Latescibacterota bacterium]
MIKPEENVSIAQYTSSKIGGVAREAYFPATTSEMLELLQTLTSSGTNCFLLGGGSNVLVGDGYWDGVVIITTRMDEIETNRDILSCGAGVLSSRAAEIALENSKTGLEFLYLLPGSLGGALAGNARYDNQNISDVLVSTLAVHPQKGMKRFKAENIDFAYKYLSIVHEGWIICELSLAWQDGDPDDIRNYMDRIEKFRNDSHHFDYPSSGCIFKNDHKNNIQAGYLIDSLGLKGLTVGGARVAEFHANFIINIGNTTARDVLELIEKIERIVHEKTGITLEREIRVAGSF